jgi:hypothetical protein
MKVPKPRPVQSARPRKSIFIPSTMTVATLAKVTNMKLGEHPWLPTNTVMLTISIRIPSNEDAAGRNDRGSQL